MVPRKYCTGNTWKRKLSNATFSSPWWCLLTFFLFSRLVDVFNSYLILDIVTSKFMSSSMLHLNCKYCWLYYSPLRNKKSKQICGAFLHSVRDSCLRDRDARNWSSRARFLFQLLNMSHNFQYMLSTTGNLNLKWFLLPDIIFGAGPLCMTTLSI